MCVSIRYLLLLLLPATTAGAAVDGAASAAVVRDLKEWLKMPREKRTVIPDTAAQTPLTKADAAELTKLLWEDHSARLKVERADEVKAKLLTLGDKEMKYEVVTFGSKAGAQPLFISMHGGGNAPAELNESQWQNQIKLGQAYKPSAGLYIAPRGPTDTWNLWHEAHIDDFFDRLIQDMIVFENVDPDKVYIMGYSAGGDGVYQLAPRMADRWAAAAMMAGHPNETSPLGLRNIGFTIHVGANDDDYNRNGIAKEWEKKLAGLQKDDPGGYPHLVRLHEGRSHWMNLEDREAVPWMEKFTRNPYPDKIVWFQDDVTHTRFYWLAVPKAEAKAGQEIIADRRGQSIGITAKDNPHMSILLNDAMLDLDQPVSVTCNGRVVPPRLVPRTLDVIRRTLAERGDPRLIFSAEINVP